MREMDKTTISSTVAPQVIRRMDAVFRLPRSPPPAMPKGALATPLPGTKLHWQVLERKLKASIRELGQTKEDLNVALRTLDECRQTMSQLEGLVGSLKGVVMHLDPIQGAHILNHEIAAIEAMIVGRERLENDHKVHPTNDVYVYQNGHTGKNLPENEISSIPSRSKIEDSSSPTVLLEHGEGSPTPLERRNSTPDPRIITISHNKSEQESILEEIVRRKQQQEQHATNSSKSSFHIWGILEQLTSQLTSQSSSESISPSSTSSPSSTNATRPTTDWERDMIGSKIFPTNVSPGIRKQDPRITTISHHPSDQELMIQQVLKRREAEKMRSKMDDKSSKSESSPTITNTSTAKKPSNELPNAVSPKGASGTKKQDPRITTISHHPSDQELMIQQALRRREEEKMASMMGDKTSKSPSSSATTTTSTAKKPWNELPNAVSPRGALGTKKQDPRKITISDHPSDQELMIQQALKRRQEEKTRPMPGDNMLQKTEASPSITTPSKLVACRESPNISTNASGEKKQDPRINTISHHPSDQELMIQQALKRREEEKMTSMMGDKTSKSPSSSTTTPTSSAKKPWNELPNAISPRGASGTKKQDPRIITISHHPSDQELMIQQALKRRQEEKTRPMPGDNILQKTEASPGITTPSKLVACRESPKISTNTAGEKKQDPRINTISHHPSDQELMIQQALKRKEEEKMRSKT